MITFKIRDGKGYFARLIKELGPAGMQELNDAAAARLWADARSYLRGYAATAHNTARMLGATPTGHLQKAANTMTHSSTPEQAKVTITSPGFKRVFGAMHITAVNARALTIPVHPYAYGRRVAEVKNAHTVFKPKGKDYLATTIDDKIVPLYLLRKSVTVPQERRLLPSDTALTHSVYQGYLAKIRAIIHRTT